MFRGTTPKHIFVIPYDVSIIKQIRVIYQQREKTILEKTEADCTLEGNTILVSLSQEDTFLFNDKYGAKIQVRILTESGEAMSSYPVSVSVNECLSEEVLL